MYLKIQKVLLTASWKRTDQMNTDTFAEHRVIYLLSSVEIALLTCFCTEYSFHPRVKQTPANWTGQGILLHVRFPATFSVRSRQVISGQGGSHKGSQETYCQRASTMFSFSNPASLCAAGSKQTGIRIAHFPSLAGSSISCGVHCESSYSSRSSTLCSYLMSRNLTYTQGRF